MSNMKGFVFWVKNANMHTACVFEEIGKKYHTKIACMGNNFRGFGEINVKYAEVIYVRDYESVKSLIDKTIDYIHINGAYDDRQNLGLYKLALRYLLEKNCFVIALYQEQYQWWTIKGLFRRIKWFYVMNIGIGRHIKAFGCTGTTGIEAHQKAFVAKKRLFDFCYIVPEPNSYLLPTPSVDNFLYNRDGSVQFVFIGSLIERKGIIPLIKTFNLIDANYTLHIIGEGTLMNDVISLANNNKKIKIWGKLEPRNVRHVLQQTDYLLQTSISEGWGCTPNEALIYGNKCIISDAVGSRALVIANSQNGFIFKSEDWKSLKMIVENCIKKGPLTNEERDKIIKWAECLYPQSAASYLIKMIKYLQGDSKDKPNAPWEMQNKTT